MRKVNILVALPLGNHLKPLPIRPTSYLSSSFCLNFSGLGTVNFLSSQRKLSHNFHILQVFHNILTLHYVSVYFLFQSSRMKSFYLITNISFTMPLLIQRNYLFLLNCFLSNVHSHAYNCIFIYLSSNYQKLYI